MNFSDARCARPALFSSTTAVPAERELATGGGTDPRTTSRTVKASWRILWAPQRTQESGEKMSQPTPRTQRAWGTRNRGRELAIAAARGAVAGLAGVAAMTAGEKLEQRVTGRPDSYVPARTLSTLIGRPRTDFERPVMLNHAMHWGTGAAVGALRGLWAVTGIRGTRASLTHTMVRLAVDQTLENTTGRGAPPTTWPVNEQALDVAHKAVYSFVTGVVCDAWIDPVQTSRHGRHSH